MKEKKINLPKISVVMPIYNEEMKLDNCLKSIRDQDYPQDKIEIVFVDDNSTDNSIEIAKKYKIKLVKNGAHDYDIGKSLGIKESTGEYIIFLDGDNILPSKNWIKNMIIPLLEDKSLVGSQLLWIKYDKKQSLFDRYCALYGITDPLTIYLNNRGHLMIWEKKWKLGLIEEREGYFTVKFNQKNLPTIGSVGFTIRKNYLLKTNYSPAFSHLDCMQDLIKQSYNKFAMVKQDIIHLHSANYSSFIGKLNRNLSIFIRDHNKRRYKWDAPLSKKIYAAVAMMTFILPTYHALRGYIKIKDNSWFIHPFICFWVILNYITILSLWKVGLKK
ncbi:MAG TPA: glycosyltransferase family 2 protein [Candidatus Paceibacterota bacterium]|nr:glycosyltransferase family 2 protein [Candidatus Paceibacterota bacterium]